LTICIISVLEAIGGIIGLEQIHNRSILSNRIMLFSKSGLIDLSDLSKSSIG
jgi:hypothetical protein